MTTKTNWTELPDTDPVFIRENKKAMKRERLAAPRPPRHNPAEEAKNSAIIAMRALRENRTVEVVLRMLMEASDRMDATGQSMSTTGRDVEAAAGYLKLAIEAAGGRI